jgi:hypothetical protein
VNNAKQLGSYQSVPRILLPGEYAGRQRPTPHFAQGRHSKVLRRTPQSIAFCASRTESDLACSDDNMLIVIAFLSQGQFFH